MRDAFDAARDQGRVNLAFMGANDAYWQIRLEDHGRTIVAYKSVERPGAGRDVEDRDVPRGRPRANASCSGSSTREPHPSTGRRATTRCRPQRSGTRGSRTPVSSQARSLPESSAWSRHDSGHRDGRRFLRPFADGVLPPRERRRQGRQRRCGALHELQRSDRLRLGLAPVRVGARRLLGHTWDDPRVRRSARAAVHAERARCDDE